MEKDKVESRTLLKAIRSCLSLTGYSDGSGQQIRMDEDGILKAIAESARPSVPQQGQGKVGFGYDREYVIAQLVELSESLTGAMGNQIRHYVAALAASRSEEATAQQCTHCRVELQDTELLCHECTRLYRAAKTEETIGKLAGAPAAGSTERIAKYLREAINLAGGALWGDKLPEVKAALAGTDTDVAK